MLFSCVISSLIIILLNKLKSAFGPKDESAYFRGTTNVFWPVNLTCQLDKSAQSLNAARRLHLLHSAQKLLSDLQTCHGETSTNRFLSMPQLQPYSSYSLPCYISNTALILPQNQALDNDPPTICSISLDFCFLNTKTTSKSPSAPLSLSIGANSS